MRRWVFLIPLFAITACVFGSRPAVAASAPAEPVRVGRANAALNGPWRFHVGDDLRAASPAFDDSAWEAVDLTPAPDSHDGDVGLPGYVSGWSKRGHAGYTGYAWYRLAVTVENDSGAPLALAGPTLVDSAYQLYVDGKLLGASGDFSGTRPTVFGVRPSVFPLPASAATAPRTYVIAMRVWMDPLDAGDDNGGVHVAPIIGSAQSIADLHQVQWLKTFVGYVADFAEPVAFVLLALMVTALIACRSGDAYRWLVVALLLLALLRVNQVLFYWTGFYSLRCYDIATNVILRPLHLAAWILAWRDWFGLDRRTWHQRALGALTAAYVILALIGRPWLLPEAFHGLKAPAETIIAGIRLVLAAIYLWFIGCGVMRSAHGRTLLAALAAVLVGVGLFATELNALGIPGIWFPYGVGVARGQYAYAAFIALLFALILMRFVAYARRR